MGPKDDLIGVTVLFGLDLAESSNSVSASSSVSAAVDRSARCLVLGKSSFGLSEERVRGRSLDVSDSSMTPVSPPLAIGESSRSVSESCGNCL